MFVGNDSKQHSNMHLTCLTPPEQYKVLKKSSLQKALIQSFGAGPDSLVYGSELSMFLYAEYVNLITFV